LAWPLNGWPKLKFRNFISCFDYRIKVPVIGL
jgi:hypothetical protein